METKEEKSQYVQMTILDPNGFYQQEMFLKLEIPHLKVTKNESSLLNVENSLKQITQMMKNDLINREGMGGTRFSN